MHVHGRVARIIRARSTLNSIKVNNGDAARRFQSPSLNRSRNKFTTSSLAKLLPFPPILRRKIIARHEINRQSLEKLELGEFLKMISYILRIFTYEERKFPEEYFHHRSSFNNETQT